MIDREASSRILGWLLGGYAKNMEKKDMQNRGKKLFVERIDYYDG